jgi:hypothetical protein
VECFERRASLRVLLEALWTRHFEFGFEAVAYRFVDSFVFDRFAKFALQPLLNLDVSFEPLWLCEALLQTFEHLPINLARLTGRGFDFE